MKPQLIKIPNTDIAIRKDTISYVRVHRNLQLEYSLSILENTIHQHYPLNTTSETMAKAIFNSFIQEYNK
jgi:hypothetical protein